VRQSLIAVFAMVLVLAVAAYEDFRRKDTVPRYRISGTVSQWSTLATSTPDQVVSFRVRGFPYELAIDAPALEAMAKRGIVEPVSLGKHVDAIVTQSDVAAQKRGAGDQGTARAVAVLGLIVDDQTVFGSPEIFRIAPTMRTWPYLVLLSVFGAAMFFGHKRRSTRRRTRRTDYDGEDSSSG
jgi:hypothetical protein